MAVDRSHLSKGDNLLAVLFNGNYCPKLIDEQVVLETGYRELCGRIIRMTVDL